MTQGRYIALVRSKIDAHADLMQRFAASVRDVEGLEVAFADRQISVATTQSAPIRLAEQGLILGSLFARGAVRPVRNLGAAEAARIGKTRGRDLIENYWGRYVAILSTPGEQQIDIVRAPLGDLPCYMTVVEGATVIASDVDLMMACDLFAPSIAWEEVARHLAIRDLQTAATCLRGLHELPGGQRLCVGADSRKVEPLWSPWTFTDRGGQLDDPADAARQLRKDAHNCVAARASQFGNIVLMLSGGLDSSIIAACLAEQGLPFHGLTLVTRDTIGDERDYARHVSRTLDTPLTEAYRDVSRIKIGTSGASRLPRPVVRSFLQEFDASRPAYGARTWCHCNLQWWRRRQCLLFVAVRGTGGGPALNKRTGQSLLAYGVRPQPARTGKPLGRH